MIDCSIEWLKSFELFKTLDFAGILIDFVISELKQATTDQAVLIGETRRAHLWVCLKLLNLKDIYPNWDKLELHTVSLRLARSDEHSSKKLDLDYIIIFLYSFGT